MTFTGKCRNQETSHLEDDQKKIFVFFFVFCLEVVLL